MLVKADASSQRQFIVVGVNFVLQVCFSSASLPGTASGEALIGPSAPSWCYLQCMRLEVVGATGPGQAANSASRGLLVAKVMERTAIVMLDVITLTNGKLVAWKHESCLPVEIKGPLVVGDSQSNVICVGF
jgi:hypothetical protein